MFENMSTEEKIAWLDAEYAKAEAAGDKVRMREIVDIGKELVRADGGVTAAQLDSITGLLETAINVTLSQIISAAEKAGIPFVPVNVLKEVMAAPKTAVRVVLEEIGDLVTVNVPDDLSGLEGL